ncbi:MAG: DUF1295 domain-containing protein [Lewinellaceae bacterium]|nr:DUF1295 domain-containing protein [Lewinellaceae bacterium]HPR00564.1 DUF1295 domain-containing protein [Saprospiraceae bacterium]
MIRTVFLLVFTLVIVPVIIYYSGIHLTSLQLDVLSRLMRVYVVAAGLCFLIGEITKNYSQVDKLWSLMPIAYAWLATGWSGWPDRMILLSVLISLWGIRLTYNFSRRGGYTWPLWKGEEDYRWAIIRAKPVFKNPFVWSMFNLFFICYYQMGLILLFTLPIVAVIPEEPQSLGLSDLILSVCVIALLFIETLADQQQWNFQQKKKQTPDSGKGFLDTGLWAIVRHPNYAAEQAIWILVYGFSIAAGNAWINWSIAGCLLLLLLFKGSSDFSESISLEKYSGYATYMKNTGRFLPRISLSRRAVTENG